MTQKCNHLFEVVFPIENWEKIKEKCIFCGKIKESLEDREESK
jgi:hypothetical protein